MKENSMSKASHHDTRVCCNNRASNPGSEGSEFGPVVTGYTLRPVGPFVLGPTQPVCVEFCRPLDFVWAPDPPGHSFWCVSMSCQKHQPPYTQFHQTRSAQFANILFCIVCSSVFWQLLPPRCLTCAVDKHVYPIQSPAALADHPFQLTGFLPISAAYRFINMGSACV